MTVLAQIRAQGFILKAVTGGLYVEPIGELTDSQRRWLIEQKPQLRQELLVERWQWFLSLATEHGTDPDVVAAEFPTEDDRLDVIEPLEHDDVTLRACMATLCRDARVKRRQRDFETGSWVPVKHEL